MRLYIILGVVILVAFLGGYKYVQMFNPVSLLKNLNTVENTNSEHTETSKKQKEKNNNLKIGNIELDSCINKIKKFETFSPRTIPEIQKSIKTIHDILNKLKQAKDSDTINYGKQLATAEGAHQHMENQISVLGLDIPSDDEAKRIFETNTNKIKKVVKGYMDEIKRIAIQKK